jgi:penicillin-insensitive murein endopeptidase
VSALGLLFGLFGVEAGCVGPGLLTDGTSVSGGTFHNGYLRRGKRLPAQGDGYVIPQLWQDRGANFGTDELVAAIRRAARRVAKEYPGGTLGVADLSLLGGGDSPLHRSHENGHDADLIWYAVDEDGKPVPPADSMPTYGRDLWAHEPHPTPNVVFGPFTPRRFDIRRNWALVRALLQDPDIEIQYLFIHNRLRRLLLDHAAKLREDDELIDRAEALLRQPGDSLPHDDHLHLRIFCAPSDRQLGCRDYGQLRWWLKRYKYMPPTPPPETPGRRVARLFLAPLHPSALSDASQTRSQ